MVENLIRRRLKLLEELRWLNWFWWRSCKSKNTFSTYDSAKALADKLNKQPKNRRHPNKVYLCKFPKKVKGRYVDHYHVGHPSKRKVKK